MIYQDPISSLNPRRRVNEIVGEGLAIWGRRKGPGQGGRDPAVGGHRPRGGRAAPPARVLRRAVPAHLDRPVAGARAVGADLRRARVGARRVGAGADPQPAGGPEGQPRPHHAVHRPRPGGGAQHQRPGGGHVPGQAVRGRPGRHPLRPARPPLHGGADRGRPRARPRHADPGHRARGRPAVPHGPAERLPVPHPLPAGPGALRGRGAPAPPGGRQRRGRRPRGGLPLPPGRRGRRPGRHPVRVN